MFKLWHDQHQPAPMPKHLPEFHDGRNWIGHVPDHVPSGDGIVLSVCRHTGPVMIQVRVVVRIGPARRTLQFRSIRAAASSNQAIGIRDPSIRGGGKRLHARADFEDVPSQTGACRFSSIGVLYPPIQ